MMASTVKKDRAERIALDEELRQAVDAEIHRRNAQTAAVPALTPFTQSTQSRRPTKGDRVMILATGKIGKIVHDDHSSIPYEIDVSGELTWCDESGVKLMDTSVD